MTLTKARPRAAPALDLRGAFVRRTDLSGANLRGADLSNADATGASFRNADFQDARLVGTILRAADLTGARNLTVDQLAAAIVDDETRLPAHIDRAKLLNAHKPGSDMLE